MKQLINLGTGPNSGVGDTLYSGSVKINENFDELYTMVDNAVSLDSIISGSGISVVLTPGIATINNTSPNVQSDWAATTGLSAILNKPVLSSIAISGSYNDLLDTPVMPTLSEVALSGDYNDLLNVPVFPTLATVAVSGDYADLSNVPAHDRLESGVFSAVLDGNIGELRIPDSLRFTLTNSDAFIHGPGAGHSMTIKTGMGDIYNSNGGSLNIFAGASMAQNGNGGELAIAAGNGANLGGNINITGGRGQPSATGDYPGRGGTVTISGGYGETYGGNAVIKAGSTAVASANGPAAVYPGAVILQANDASWQYKFDGSVREPHASRQSTSVVCQPGAVTEVYASVYEFTPLIKLLITVTGSITGDNSGSHTEAMEVMVVTRASGGTPVVQIFNRVRTSTSPLVNVTASVNNATNLVTVYCQPVDDSNAIQVITMGTEPTTVITGQVLI